MAVEEIPAAIEPCDKLPLSSKVANPLSTIRRISEGMVY